MNDIREGKSRKNFSMEFFGGERNVILMTCMSTIQRVVSKQGVVSQTQ